MPLKTWDRQCPCQASRCRHSHRGSRNRCEHSCVSAEGEREGVGPCLTLTYGELVERQLRVMTTSMKDKSMSWAKSFAKIGGTALHVVGSSSSSGGLNTECALCRRHLCWSRVLARKVARHTRVEQLGGHRVHHRRRISREEWASGEKKSPPLLSQSLLV